MPGVVKIDITESAEELQTVMSRQSKASERSKAQVLWWLKTGQVTTVTQAAAQGGITAPPFLDGSVNIAREDSSICWLSPIDPVDRQSLMGNGVVALMVNGDCIVTRLV